jgi:signal peptidase II
VAPSNNATPTAKPVAEHSRAARSLRAVVLFVAVAVAALAADLVSKELVFGGLLDDESIQQRVSVERVARDDRLTAEQALHFYREPLFGPIRMSLSTNPGVVFGLPMPRWLVALATVGTVVLVALIFAFSPAGDHALHLAMALILGGALGNLYDRLFSAVYVPGYKTPIVNQVRDFVDASEMGYPWIFNLADAWLVAGVGILLLHWLAGSIRQWRIERSGDRHS